MISPIFVLEKAHGHILQMIVHIVSDITNDLFETHVLR